MRVHHRLVLGTALLAAITAPAFAQHAGHREHAPRQEKTVSPAPSASATPMSEGEAYAGHAQLKHVHADHDGHVMPPEATHAPSVSLPEPTAAERVAAFPDMHGMRMQDHMDDDPVLATLQFDRLEWQDAGDDSGLGWELQGWAGDLENRLWLRSEGERRDSRTEHGDVELLWGRPTGPWWDAMLGVRHDLGEGPSRNWLAFGAQGLAPYKFEVSATGYVGQEGRIAARLEAEYDTLLTNRLILQPRAELNAYSKDDPEVGIGKGISDASLGLRLRYEITRQFAPYVGYEWSRSFGRAADFAEQAGDEDSESMWVAGVKFWF